jgi:hypothetical protein
VSVNLSSALPNGVGRWRLSFYKYSTPNGVCFSSFQWTSEFQSDSPVASSLAPSRKKAGRLLRRFTLGQTGLVGFFLKENLSNLRMIVPSVYPATITSPDQ